MPLSATKAVKNDLREVARSMGVNPKVLLCAVWIEFLSLRKEKRFEIVSDYYMRVSEEILTKRKLKNGKRVS